MGKDHSGVDYETELTWRCGGSSSPSTTRRELRRLNARHREIIRRVAQGDKSVDIAEDLDMSPGTISTICNSPLFKQELDKWMQALDDKGYDAMQELVDSRKAAVLALRESVCQTELPVLRFHAARDILNRTGVTVPKEYHVTKQQTSYEEVLHSVRIKNQADDLERKRPPIMVEYEESE